MPKKKIRGKIISGVRKGAFFMMLSWVQEQCFEKLGFKPYPGTLNLEIAVDDIQIIEALRPEEGLELMPPDSNFCSGRVFPVSIEGISGAIVLPAEDVRVHGNNIIEIISPQMLKKAMDVKDGDLLSITLDLHQDPINSD